MNNHRQMLRDVQKLDFAALETALFLDNQPHNKEALKCFNHYQSAAKQAREKYECHFGPLQYQDQRGTDFWEWTKGPWPWEGEV